MYSGVQNRIEYFIFGTKMANSMTVWQPYMLSPINPWKFGLKQSTIHNDIQHLLKMATSIEYENFEKVIGPKNVE